MSTEQARTATIDAYREFSCAVSGYARRLTTDIGLAQDTVQETFLRYFLALMQGESIRNPSAWLHRVAHNYICETQRSSAVRACVALSDEIIETASVGPETGEAEWAEAFERLLAPREFLCLRLRTEGLDYTEIAAVMSIRPGTVGTLLHRAACKLRTGFGERGRPW
jgi:RNA polymerase sigma-70 factor, ECF subfamily